MTGIFSASLPLILRIVGFFAKRAAIKEATWNRWLETVDLINKDLGKSAALNHSDSMQKDDLDAQWEQLHKEDPEVAIMERQNPGMKFKRDANGNIVPDKSRKT